MIDLNKPEIESCSGGIDLIGIAVDLVKAAAKEAWDNFTAPKA